MSYTQSLTKGTVLEIEGGTIKLIVATLFSIWKCVCLRDVFMTYSQIPEKKLLNK